MNRRTKTLFIVIFTLLFIFSIVLLGILIPYDAIKVDFTIKNLPPSKEYIFGTDWLGRDMFLRTIKGLSISIIMGVFSSLISVVIALIMGLIAGISPKIGDTIVSFLIDIIMSLPHLLFLVLISFIMGRGFKGIFVGILLTHWTSLARVIRGEILQIRNEHYIGISKKLGKNSFYIVKNHILPFILPQVIVGSIILFPHTILHESSITFLGFGFSPETPAIGIILSESMKYISMGYWWLAFFPGFMLVLVVILFDLLGENVKILINPYTYQE